ncbi:MAG: plasmid recombination protein [Proteobacteria bacterium]|nr:plasmid recombination protein [Pseudomonadota bacterium]
MNPVTEPDALAGANVEDSRRKTGGEFFMRFKTAGSKDRSIVLKAARHNGREIQAELGSKDHGSVDGRRSHLNRRLHGPETALEVAALAKSRMKEANCKVRANAALMLEAVFSLSSGSGIDEHAYFNDCLSWAADTFGGWVNVLCADVHNDQRHPHMHVLMVPIKDGKLSGSRMMEGGRERLKKLEADFFKRVASRFGLRPGAPLPLGRPRKDVAADVIDRLMTSGDPATQSVRWHAFREMIEADPEPLAMLMCIDTGKPRKLKTMAKIFTSKGAGSPKEKTPRGLRCEDPKLLSCVGVLQDDPAPEVHDAAQPGVEPAGKPTLNDGAKHSGGVVDTVRGDHFELGQQLVTNVVKAARRSREYSQPLQTVPQREGGELEHDHGGATAVLAQAAALAKQLACLFDRAGRA